MKTLIEICETSAARFPDKTVFTFVDRRLRVQESFNFLQLLQAVTSLAATLQKILSAREKVILLLPHGMAFIHVFLACQFSGAIPACRPMPRRGEWVSLSATLTQLGITRVITTEKFAGSIQEQLDSPAEILVYEQLCKTQAGFWKCPNLDQDDLAFLQFSSGTTGQAKAIGISHRNMLDNSARIKKAMQLTAKDVTLSWLPFHHDMGLIGHIIQSLYSGLSTFFIQPSHFVSRPLDWLKAIEVFSVSVTGAPNFGFRRCVEAMKSTTAALPELASLRLLYSGSELINATVIAEFYELLQSSALDPDSFYACYGLADATLFVCGNSGLNTDSSSQPGFQHVCICEHPQDAGVSVLDVETGQNCTDNQTGEIVVDTASVATLVTAAGRQTRHPPLHTGDLGFIKAGRLYCIGRKPARLKINGRLLQAEVAETAILNQGAVPEIRQLILFQTRSVAQELVAMAECERSRKVIDQDDLSTRLKAAVCSVTGYGPVQVMLLPANTIPLTTSGKPVRAACIDLYEQAALQKFPL